MHGVQEAGATCEAAAWPGLLSGLAGGTPCVSHLRWRKGTRWCAQEKGNDKTRGKSSTLGVTN
jgi:hypothetical protein